jgi:hypothetical protein
MTGKQGALYGLNYQEVYSTAKGGIERCLDPLSSLPTFETINSGLSAGVALQKFWIEDNILWATDAVNPLIWTLSDTLNKGIVPLTPAEGSTGLTTRYITISWEGLEGASSYEWQVDTYPEFIDPEDKFKGLSLITSKKLPALDYDTTYYWRVRANEPVLSHWSEIRSFKTMKKSSSSGGGGSSGSGSTKTTTTITAAPSPVPSPTPAPATSSTPAATSTGTAPQKTTEAATTTSASPSPRASPVSTITADPQSGQASPSPSNEAQSGSLDSLIRLVAMLMGGLIVLSIVLLVLVIAMMKKFKTHY